MKKQLTILSLSALTLFSCGGNKSQNQSVAEKTDSAKTVMTEPSNNTVEAAEVSENLDSVLQKINPWLKKLPENPDRQFYFFEHEVDTIKGLAYFKDFLYAYPFKTGGYLTVSEHSEMSEENYIPMTQRETYIYKDGKLSSATFCPYLTPSCLPTQKKERHIKPISMLCPRFTKDVPAIM